MRTVRLHGAFLGVASFLFGALPAAYGDSWMPYRGSVQSDATGRRYVVLHPPALGRGAEFLLCEAAPGSPDVVEVWQKDADAKPGPEIDVRTNDRVVLTGSLRSAPLHVRVSSAGLGFAALVEWFDAGHGDSFVWVGADGKTNHVRRIEQLFTQAEIDGFPKTSSSTMWFRAAWNDDEAKEVVVVGSGGLVRVVSMVTGRVRAGGDAEVLRGIRLSDPAARIPAADLLADSRAPGADEALVAVFASPTASAVARLHAAGSLAKRGDRRGKDLLVALAKTPPPAGVDREDRGYALEHLPFALGLDAIPALKDAMRGEPKEGWSEAGTGFVALGQKATAALVAMLTEPNQSDGYRAGALRALERIKDRSALPALLAAAADPSVFVASSAMDAAIETGGASISKELAALLDRNTTQDSRIAAYFREVKEPASVGPLVRALRRSPRSAFSPDYFREALSFQTNAAVRHDGSVETWEAWFRGQTKFK